MEDIRGDGEGGVAGGVRDGPLARVEGELRGVTPGGGWVLVGRGKGRGGTSGAEGTEKTDQGRK